MGLYAQEVRETGAVLANVEAIIQAEERLAGAVQHTVGEMAKGARAVGPVVLSPSGAPVSGGGASGSSRGSGAGSGAGGRGSAPTTGPAYAQSGVPLDIGTTKPMDEWTAEDWAAYYETVFGTPNRFRRYPSVSAQSGGGGGGRDSGGAPRRLFPRLTPAGGNTGPIIPAGGNTGSIVPAGGGKAAVHDSTNASLLGTVARGVAETNRILGSLSRGDGGAQLFRERIVP